jgi:hypothetical protein
VAARAFSRGRAGYLPGMVTVSPSRLEVPAPQAPDQPMPDPPSGPAVPDGPPSEDPAVPTGPDMPEPRPANEPQPEEGPEVPATDPKGPEIPGQDED